jgi:hypothetical protein
MFKRIVPFVILFPLILFAQTATTHKPAANTPAAKSPSPSSTETKPTVDTNALSKDYRKAATIALSSIEDWGKAAREVSHSMRYSAGSVYSSGSASDRESDARKKAEQDVKLAKIDVDTPADKDFQKRLQKYLVAATTVNESFTHLTTGSLPKSAISTMAACEAILERALDDASSEVFAEHPDECNPDQQ